MHEVASLSRGVSSVPKCNLASTCDSVKTSFVLCNNFISCLERFSSKLVNRLSRVDSLVQCTPKFTQFDSDGDFPSGCQSVSQCQ